MGVYNTYAGVQLKVGGDLDLTEYKVRDKVPLENGIYIGYEGAVVIVDKKLVRCFYFLVDKWGKVIEPREILERKNIPQ